MAATTGRVTQRAATREDAEFLLRLYAATREEELAGVPWSAERKRAFVAQQFAARTDAYARAADAFDVVLLDGEPVGRLTLARRDGEIRIVDIALLPEHRGRGIGSRLIREVQDEAAAAGLPVTIHVERSNRAAALYRRLGFAPVEEGEVYALLRWEPPR